MVNKYGIPKLRLERKILGRRSRKKDRGSMADVNDYTGLSTKIKHDTNIKFWIF